MNSDRLPLSECRVNLKFGPMKYFRTSFSKNERLLLTLRLLMSYICVYIYIYMEHLFLMFLDHTQRLSTVGRTALDE